MIVMSISCAELSKGQTFAIQSQTSALSFTNLSYGPHERNSLDLWQSKGESPRPLLVYIHGGAWTGLTKNDVLTAVDIDAWLAKGVSVASVDYRYSTDAILPAPVHDAARAIQFLRYKAQELNIDSSHIALQGGSAGGCSTLWILFHDDLADSSSSDPVSRESSRVQGAVAQFPQTSIDPVMLNDWIGILAASHGMIFKAFGAQSYSDLMQNYNDHKPLLDEFSPINHMDPGDPPLFIIYYSGDITLPPASSVKAIHHGMFGIKLKEKADEIGYSKCDLSIPGIATPAHYATPNQFLEAVLLGTE